MSFNYMDLFCGIGGFHQALDKLSTEKGVEVNCLFAADNNKFSSEIYQKNYNLNCYYDLTDPGTHILIEEIMDGKELDLICGGFPCQSFSHAGKQEGFISIDKGNLFFQMHKVIKKYQPKYLLLENVRNLKKHDNEMSWKIIKSMLENTGYRVDDVIMGPNCLDKPIPAIRDRIYIMGYRNDIVVNEQIFFNGKNLKKYNTSIYNNRGYLRREFFYTDLKPNIEPERERVLEMWNDFRERLKKNNVKLISPVWTKYFKHKIDYSKYPEWKQKLIKKNQNFYIKNQDIIDQWLIDYSEFWNEIPYSYKKFEWTAGDRIDSVWQGIIQFRPSGVRVKDNHSFPTFVAINQTPIIGCERRYIHPSEMSRLYGFRRLKFGNQLINESYKQLGNTVSVDVVYYLLKFMFDNKID